MCHSNSAIIHNKRQQLKKGMQQKKVDNTAINNRECNKCSNKAWANAAISNKK